MRTLKPLILLLSLSLFASCYRANESANSRPQAQVETTKSVPPSDVRGLTQGDNAQLRKVSLNQADQSQSVSEAFNRKIIKDADITLEVDSPLEIRRRVVSIAEARGGFVVTSESKQRSSDDPSQQVTDVSLVIRVPESQFGPTRDEILKLGGRVLDSKDTGQDVTEEFIDLEARIKTQVALEAQFMEIMKQARKVEDALEVQRQIAEVRTEIEKLQGRKGFLENRSSLSTITVNLKAPTTVLVSPSGFGYEIKDAAKESISIARGIVVFLVRFVIVMFPVVLFVILPSILIVRFFVRRARRLRVMPPIAAPTAPAARA